MSRFSDGNHQSLIRTGRVESPEDWRGTKDARAAMLCGKRAEKRLWKRTTRWVRVLRILGLLLLASIPVVGVLGVVFFDSLPHRVPFLLFLLPVSGLLALALIGCLIAHTLRRRSIRERMPVHISEFIGPFASMDRSRQAYIEATRQALGFVYRVDPNIIYASDTADSLGRTLGFVSEPRGFELVVSVLNMLGLVGMTDADVDRIVSRIHEQADSVETLICILADELAAVEAEVSAEAQRGTQVGGPTVTEDSPANGDKKSG